LDDDVTNKSFLALALAKAGNRDEAVKQLDLLKQESSKRYVSGHAFALVYLALGNKDEALTWLEKEVEDRSTYASFYAIDPLLEDVREEPRFKALLKRMNLPE
jgi:tetratricopeptide (TPR) repeat protein